MNRYNATLFFKSIQSAMDCGYCDAVENDDEAYPYIAVVTFQCDEFLIEGDEDELEVDLSAFEIAEVDEDQVEMSV